MPEKLISGTALRLLALSNRQTGELPLYPAPGSIQACGLPAGISSGLTAGTTQGLTAGIARCHTHRRPK